MSTKRLTNERNRRTTEGMGYFRQPVTRYVDVISCDGSNCFASITEDVDDPISPVQGQAFKAGWIQEYPQWFCPACAEKRKDKTP